MIAPYLSHYHCARACLIQKKSSVFRDTWWLIRIHILPIRNNSFFKRCYRVLLYTKTNTEWTIFPVNVYSRHLNVTYEKITRNYTHITSHVMSCNLPVPLNVLIALESSHIELQVTVLQNYLKSHQKCRISISISHWNVPYRTEII